MTEGQSMLFFPPLYIYIYIQCKVGIILGKMNRPHKLMCSQQDTAVNLLQPVIPHYTITSICPLCRYEWQHEIYEHQEFWLCLLYRETKIYESKYTNVMHKWCDEFVDGVLINFQHDNWNRRRTLALSISVRHINLASAQQ